MRNKNLLNYLIKIRDKMLEDKKTLGISESCTGGYLSYLFNFLPNSSKIFKGSIVVYTNEIKERVLKVDSYIIKKFGAVSKETSFEMAKKTKEILNVNYSIGITGNFGPILQEGKDKGLIYVTILLEDDVILKRYFLNGTREEIRQKIVYNVIYLLYVNLMKGVN